MCFRMDFLNTKKKFIFLHFWILQHVYKTPKGIGQYSKKYDKKNIKKCFCVLHTANTLTCFEHFFLYTKNIGSFENVFSHGFLKHKKKFIFLHF